MGSIPTAATTGRIEMFDGTTDGKFAYLDPSTNEHNLKPKKVHHVVIHDIRSQHPAPQIVENGYEVMSYPTSLTEDEFMKYKSPEGKQYIKDNYWPELRDMVQKKTNACEVIPWHFSVRNQTAGYHPDEVFFMKTGISQPAATIHVDNDHTTAIDHMRRELGAERAEGLVGKYRRWAIINVWRPVGQPVQCWPLLVVDHKNIPHWNFADHVEKVHRNNDPKYYKAYDNFLKWHPDYVYRYASQLRPDELIMFRDYDSRTDKFRGCPHGGFQDDNTPADAPPRRSIEVRLFVFWDDDGLDVNEEAEVEAKKNEDDDPVSDEEEKLEALAYEQKVEALTPIEKKPPTPDIIPYSEEDLVPVHDFKPVTSTEAATAEETETETEAEDLVEETQPEETKPEAAVVETKPTQAANDKVEIVINGQ